MATSHASIGLEVMLFLRIVIWGAVFARTYLESTSGSRNIGLYLWLSIALHTAALVSLPWVLDGEPAAIAIMLTALALAHPWVLARRVFIPIGAWRLSFACGWLARIRWGGEGHGALIAGAWALHRRRKAPTAGLDFVYTKIQGSSFSAASVLAAGLVSAARGDRDSARALLESMGHLDMRDGRTAHRMAGEYLMADAAECGQWRRLRRLSASWEPRSTTARFLNGVSLRILGDAAAPSNAALIVAWLLAPHRLRTRSALYLGLAASDSSVKREPTMPPRVKLEPSGDDALARALSLHVRLTANGRDQVELEEVIQLARAWDQVFATGELDSIARERAADLESGRATTVSSEFRTEIGDDLATIVRASNHRLDRLPEDSESLARASSIVREALLSAVELGFDALEDRSDAKRDLPPIDEWREFLALRALHGELARTATHATRQLVFPQIHHASCNHAAWLWNERREYTLANAIFRWLLAEATIVGDQRAIELQRSNCDVR